MIIRSLSMFLGLVLASATSVLVAAPARAADTTLTFSVAGGALSISAPGNASLGSIAQGGSQSGQLGTVTVTDQRSALVATWTASVDSSSFAHTGNGSVTIGAGQVSYWSGASTASSGVGVFTPGQLLEANAEALGASRTAFSLTGGTGNNSASWNPTVVVAVPSNAIAGTYSGTITHSVL